MSRAGLVLALVAALSAQPAPERLTLEIRVFAGTEDVTGETRVTVHRAGERGQPIGKVAAIDPRVVLSVPPGIYDAQAVRERDGRAVAIRWAERLVVMPYPDEGGHHLEVINFTAGYGALQCRGASTRAGVELALFGSGERKPPARPGKSPDYTLFVVPAGQYDIQITRGTHATWHKEVEVPLDRTRLWIAP